MTASEPPSAGLALRAISHRYDHTPVLDDVSLEVAPGEIVCLLGPSGSGKSTLLRVTAGLEPLQAGEIWLDGARMAAPGDDPPPERRSIGLVFQDHVLFPHRTVAENLAFGLNRRSAAARREIVRARLESVGLAGLGNRYPHTLSGGQQQRVALARALAPEPAVMLLDEPFASVDATLRRRLREDARRALKASSSPTIVVTHDPDEALELADRIAIIVAGRIVQSGEPETVWRHPASRFVAELFGDAESFAGWVNDGRVFTAFGEALASVPPGVTREDVDVVVRPRDVIVDPSGTGATVSDIRFLGDRYVTVVEADSVTLRSVAADAPSYSVGDNVGVTFESHDVLVYDRE